MKKLIAVILSIMMVLCAVSAMAESTGKVTIGTVSINGEFTLQCGIPEGYEPVPGQVTPSQVTAVIRSQDPNAPIMQLSVAFDEKYSDVERMNDLTEEELAQLEGTYVEDDPIVEITYGETGYGTLLLVARHETEEMDYISFFSIYKGYCVEFVLAPSMTAEDKNLTEEQLRLSVDFLTDLDFIPANTPVVNQKTIAGQSFTTNLTEYNAEDNTVKAEVKRPIHLDTEVLDSLEEGDLLTIGQEVIQVETLERDEFGAVVNGEIDLTREEDYVRVSSFEHEYMDTIATLTLEIPENMVFVDGINPETGEMLEEPTEHTAAEFTAMLAAGGYPDFASDNVTVTFDDDGNMVRAERFYTPWQ